MLIPRPKHVMISAFHDPDMTPSGLLHVPDSAKGRSDQGIVKYVGKNCSFIEPGMYVLYNGYAGETINMSDEEETLIDIHESNCVAIITSAEFEKITVDGLYYKSHWPLRIDEDRRITYDPIPINEALALIKQTIRSHTSIQNYMKSDRHLFRDTNPEDTLRQTYDGSDPDD